MIDGLIITPLKKIPSEQGTILHMLKKDDGVFKKFGEIYFSTVYPNMIKGWHCHKKSVCNYAVPIGMIKLVVFDSRRKSKTYGELQEVILGEDNHVLVTIPNNVWSSFKSIGQKTSLLANLSTLPHSPTDDLKLELDSKKIPYTWK